MEMLKAILMILMLCVTPNVFAQEEQTPEQAVELFMSKSDMEKQSILMDLISVKKIEQADYLLDQWEKTAHEGKGPSEFLKSYIKGLINSAREVPGR